MKRGRAMLEITDNTALIIIDAQCGMDEPYWGTRNNPDAEQNIARLLTSWRERGRPIFHVQHMSTTPTSPLRPNQPGNAIKSMVAPQGDEPVIQKNVNSAFIGTDLEDRLRANGIDSLVIVGLTTNHCVETTTRMAGNLGFNTMLVGDATATFDRIGPGGQHFSAEVIHAVSLASLHGEFATVVKTDDLLN
jgi:nicotinamidase-related amidase